MVRIIPDKRGCQINSKTVSARLQPEFHDLLKFLAHADTRRMIGRKLPRGFGLGVAVIESRLKMKKVRQIPLGAAILAGIQLRAGNVLSWWRPDIPVGILIGPIERRFLEPMAHHGRMTGYKI